MHTYFKHALGSLTLFVLFFSAAWVAFDITFSVAGGAVKEATAAFSCGGCDFHSDGGGGGGGFGFGGGFSGGGGDGGGGGGGGGTPPKPPVCTLGLTKDTISWTTNNANNVSIVPLTASPAVPGASVPSGTPPGTVLFNGDFGAFKAEFASVFQQDATANGGITLGNASFKANKATADRLCQLAFTGTVVNSFLSDTFSSPKNNTIAIWNGSSWSVVPAKGNDPHLRNNFSCATPLSGTSPFTLSGSTNFVPPLGVGIHTYKLTAIGGGGNTTCQATVVVPPPPPPPEASGCVDVLKETFDPSGAKITPVAQFSFMLDGTTVSSDSNGVAKFTGVTPGTHTVSEVNPGSAWSLLSVTPSGGTVVVGSGPACSTVVFKNQQVIPPPPPPPGAPTCTLATDPSSITSGTASTLAWTTTNAVSFVVDQGVGSLTPVGAGTTSTHVLTTTTNFIGTATNAGGASVTCVASVGVLPPPPPSGPFCALSVSKTPIDPGESIAISWVSSNVTSGSIDRGIGNASPVSGGTIDNIFPSEDTIYTGTFTGPNGTATCSATVTIKKGGGGCTTNCGGGLNQPNVQLAKVARPGEQPLAFVSLSQIPYTGFEAGPLLTVLFWLAVILWSFGMTYLFMGKESLRLIAGRFLPGMTVHDTRAEDGEYEYDASEDPATLESGHKHAGQTVNAAIAPAPSYAIAPSVIAPPAPASEAPALPGITRVEAIEGIPPLAAVIESRANAAGVLLSPEAVALANGLEASRHETLVRFGAILNEAVRTMPREDGWIILSAERLRSLAGSTIGDEPKGAPAAALPVVEQKREASPLDETAANRFVSAVLAGDRDSAFSLLTSLEREGVSASKTATAVASVLDTLYRAKRSGGVYPDLSLGEKAAHLSDETLATLVEVFARALDTAYVSEYTGLKIALAKAFDIRTA